MKLEARRCLNASYSRPLLEGNPAGYERPASFLSLEAMEAPVAADSII